MVDSVQHIHFPPNTGNMGVGGCDGYDKLRYVGGFWDISNQELGKGNWRPPRAQPIQNYHLANPRSTPPFDTVQQTYPKPDDSRNIDPATHIGSAEENNIEFGTPHYTFAEEGKAGTFRPMVFTEDHWVTGTVKPFNPSPSLGGPTAERIFGVNF